MELIRNSSHERSLSGDHIDRQEFTVRNTFIEPIEPPRPSLRRALSAPPPSLCTDDDADKVQVRPERVLAKLNVTLARKTATDTISVTETSWGSEPGSASQCSSPWSGSEEGAAPITVKWAVLVRRRLARQKQDTLRQAVTLEIEKYRAHRSTGTGDDDLPESFKALADVPEHQWSLGTIACLNGKPCTGCWKHPRQSCEGTRRKDRGCLQGMMCKFCHCHLAGKPNQKSRKLKLRMQLSSSSVDHELNVGDCEPPCEPRARR